MVKGLVVRKDCSYFCELQRTSFIHDKNFDEANAVLNDSVQKFLKKGFNISAVNAAMGLICVASEKKDKDAAMAAAVSMRDYMRLAVNALKPGQANEAGSAVGLGIAAPKSPTSSPIRSPALQILETVKSK